MKTVASITATFTKMIKQLDNIIKLEEQKQDDDTYSIEQLQGRQIISAREVGAAQRVRDGISNLLGSDEGK